MTLTTIKPAGLSKPVDLADGEKLRFGTGNDLQIEHTGGANSIQAAASQYLYIYADELRLNSKTGTEKFISMSVNGATELYYDNSKKLETTSWGTSITGTLIASSNIKTASDTGKLMVGAGDDLQIYHDGTNSYIKNDTGGLRLSVAGGSNQVQINKGAVDEQMAKFIADGAVELYHNNVKTAFTSLDAWNVYGRTSNSGMLEIASNQGANNNDRFQIHKTSASSTLAIRNYTSGSWETNLKAIGNGAVELYYDNSKKLETVSVGSIVSGKLGINVTPSRTITAHVSDSGANYIHLTNSSTGSGDANGIFIGLDAAEGALMWNQADNYVRFGTNNAERMRITNSGRVGIGDTNPQSKLAVSDGGSASDPVIMAHVQNSNGGFLGFGLYSTINSKYTFKVTNNGRIHVNDGIDFNMTSNASGMTSELLDDYEEGTFTPTYGWNNASQSGFSTSQNSGYYVKIGNLVHIEWWTNFTATPSTGNSLQLQLPFSAHTSGGYRGGVTYSWSNITWASNTDRSQGGRTHINSGASWMEVGFRSHLNGNSWDTSGITPSGMADNASFQGSGSYFVPY